jgi:hypothetical protein
MAVEVVTTARIHENTEHWKHTSVTTELLLTIGAIVLSILGIIGVSPS